MTGKQRRKSLPNHSGKSKVEGNKTGSGEIALVYAMKDEDEIWNKQHAYHHDARVSRCRKEKVSDNCRQQNQKRIQKGSTLTVFNLEADFSQVTLRKFRV